MLKKKWLPEDDAGLELHEKLGGLRHQTYAHTERNGTRAPSVTYAIGYEGETKSLAVGEAWIPLPREVLPAIITLSERQHARFFAGAAAEADAIRADKS